MAQALSVALRGDVLITAMGINDVNWLEEKFAVMSPAGWTIPEWLRVLRKQVQANSLQSKVRWMFDHMEDSE